MHIWIAMHLLRVRRAKGGREDRNITSETNKSAKYLQLTLKNKSQKQKSYRPFPKSSNKVILTNLLYMQPGPSHYNR